ncbi:MAG: M28 family peptidase [Candidatus Muiribacteriota bacterium]
MLKNFIFKLPPLKRLIFTTAIAFILAYSFFVGNCGLKPTSKHSPEGDFMESEMMLKKHVIELSSKIGDRNITKYSNLIEAENYIHKELAALGYDIYLQEYKVKNPFPDRHPFPVRNIIASHDLDNRKCKNIIIGAHYDTVFNSPGADDNASAVAGMIELARLLKNHKSDYNFKFIAFVNEEPPFFQTEEMGSLVYTRWAKERNLKIEGAVILEMIGYFDNTLFSQSYPAFLGLLYPNRGNFLAFVGNKHSASWTNKIYNNFRKESDFPVEMLIPKPPVPYVDFSDHWSFHKMNYPAFMITDTAFLRNPNYHKASDTYDTLKYDWMAEFINHLAIVLKNTY